MVAISQGRQDYVNEILMGVSLKKGNTSDGSNSVMSFILKYGRE